MSNGTNEKQDSNYFQPPSPQPPPAYNAPPPQAQWPPLAEATALYQYTSADAGDLELQPNDHITVTEFMNAEWWKGKSTRTGQEGIFPRSYVKVNEEKAAQNTNKYGNNYGNQPLEVRISLVMCLLSNVVVPYFSFYAVFDCMLTCATGFSNGEWRRSSSVER